MKNIKNPCTLIFLAWMVMPLTAAFGQESDLAKFLNGGKQDAALLMKAYLNPVVEGISYGMNGGWVTSAQAHKSLGIDLGLSVSSVFIPTSKNIFDPSALGLKTVTATGNAPTMVGPALNVQYNASIDTNNDGKPDQNIAFTGPPGLDFTKNIGFSAVPAVMVQAGIGIYKNTDLKFRYFPKSRRGTTDVSLIGFGLMHDIKQHIPGIKFLPFDLSLFAGYTQVSGQTRLEGKLPKPTGNTAPQALDYAFSAWLVQAVISKKISVFTFYGGVGLNAVNTTADVKGSYVIFDNAASGTQIALTDPVNMTFKNMTGRLTGGMRLKLGFFFLHGDYTLQEYNTLTVGMGFTFR